MLPCWTKAMNIPSFVCFERRPTYHKNGFAFLSDALIASAKSCHCFVCEKNMTGRILREQIAILGDAKHSRHSGPSLCKSCEGASDGTLLSNSKMFYIFLILFQFTPIYSTYSASQLNDCLTKCGVGFDPLPEAFESNYRSMGSAVATPYSSPWTVLIIFSSSCPNGGDLMDRCTGFIVSPDIVLTAAHCIFFNYNEMLARCNLEVPRGVSNTWARRLKEQLSIYIGFTDLYDNPNKDVKLLSPSDIRDIILPSEFRPSQLEDGKALKYDYAIIQLAKPLSFGESLRPVCLSIQLIEPTRKWAQIAGWGQTINEDNKKILTGKMHSLSVPIQDTDECLSRPSVKAMGFDPNFHLCTGARGLGGLEGDSGAAVTVDVSGRSYAVGIFSMVTTNSSYRNVMPDISVRTSRLCDTLQTINKGTRICQAGFIKLEHGCEAILRERRLQLAEYACGSNKQCQGKIAVGNINNHAKVHQNLLARNDGERGSPSQLHQRETSPKKMDLDQAAQMIHTSISRGEDGGGLIKMFKKRPKSDTEQILAILSTSNFTTRQLICRAYANNYQQEDLIGTIQKELPEDGPKELILALLYSKDMYDAITLHKAMKGLGTDEHVLTEILVSRSNDQMRAIRKAYTDLYSTELVADIADNTSGTYGRILVNLCAANRNESGVVSTEKAAQDAKALFEAGEKRLDTTAGDTFLAMLTRDNQLQLNAFFHEYEQLTGNPMEKTLATEFSGDALDAFTAIVRISRNSARYFADLFFAAIKKQNEMALIRLVVTRAESCEMPAIAAEFKKMYGSTMAEQILSLEKVATKETLAKLA